MSSIFGLLLILLVVTLVLHVVARVWRVPVAAESFQRRPWLPTHWREPLEEGETVEFSADDGASLNGTFLPRSTEIGRGVVVYSHELNGDRWNALSYVDHLRSEGFDVFTFDYRSHGKASRDRWERSSEITMSDVADLRAAVQAAVQKASQSEPAVGIIGVGKGAAVALCAAGDTPAVRALVLDSIHPLAESATLRKHAFAEWWNQLRRHFVGPSRDARCDLKLAAQKTAVPVLLIHGRKDIDVPLDAVRTLATQIAGPCQLWVVPGARHAEAIGVDRTAYRRRTSNFFTQSLRPKPATARKTYKEKATSDMTAQEAAAPPVPQGSISSVSMR